ncbi:hypothetical protein B0H65DRAFT_245975 [Neurospora tetraspora]|uniref:Uncharacterized protein n=1 Tax=Neurospora tetraspora TaxID=94610 RepID=A0AAE0JF48_9PEZI|nr:hypothetical protein B0H65DRAFT_245975 [Neurospora tetraspora]
MSSHSCLQTSASSLRCCSGYCRTTQHGVAGILDGTAHGFPDLPRSWLFFVTLQLHGKSTRHQPATARQAAETSLIPRILSLQLLPFTSSHRFPSTLNTRPFSEPPKRSQGQEGRECLDTVTRFGDLAQRRVISQLPYLKHQVHGMTADHSSRNIPNTNMQHYRLLEALQNPKPKFSIQAACMSFSFVDHIPCLHVLPVAPTNPSPLWAIPIRQPDTQPRGFDMCIWTTLHG